ncbi:MAG: iron ABC transporter permease [Campylobacteraceae bacterium]|nr:iron ABC transporter permease [Campylobacteraceae bacterium]
MHKSLHTNRTFFWGVGLVLALVATLVLGIVTSHAGFMWADITHLGKDSKEAMIIYQLRLPRIVAALLGGALLALSGAVMQGVLKNPLASPFTLGVSQAAAFGASFAIILLQAFQNEGGAISVVGAAFLSSMICMMCIVWLGSKAAMSPSALILAGVALGTLFHALTMLMQFFATDLDAAASLFWTFGDMGKATWDHVKIQTIAVLVLGVGLGWQHWRLDALGFGDESAQSRGVRVKPFRLIMLILATLSAALVVAYFGIIGFVGLAAPHLVRFGIASRNGIVIPFGMLVGAILLALADILARVVVAPIVIPIGIVTALLGVPILLVLLAKRVNK